MLFVDNIKNIIKLGIVSSYLKNEKTYLNFMLLAYPEAGKSSILLNFDFRKLKNVFVFTDLTKSKLEDFLKKIQNPKPVKYLVIPDFTRVLSHGKDTEARIVGMLNSGMEEGIRELTTYFTGSIVHTEPLKTPVKFGIATSMTRQYMEDRRRIRKWHNIGFFSRFLPVSFSYTKEQVKKVRDYIKFGRDIIEKPEILKIKELKVECQPKFVSLFDKHIDMLAEASSLYGFRYTRQFRIMLKANALLRGSKKVTAKDVKDITPLMRYINLNYNEVVE